MDDEKIREFVNEKMTEQVIQNAENQILHCLKTLHEHYPSEKNNQAWLDYSNFISLRRRLAKIETTGGVE